MFAHCTSGCTTRPLAAATSDQDTGTRPSLVDFEAGWKSRA
ncbi:MAG: hypothetical protein ACRDVL_11140 [Acidimicrobiia bacterium]